LWLHNRGRSGAPIQGKPHLRGVAGGWSMPPRIEVSAYVARSTQSAFGHIALDPWQITHAADAIIRAALDTVGREYCREGEIAVHPSAVIESGAVLKPPAIVGEGCLIASGAYLRGGVYLDERCTIGPASELKTSFLFRGTKLAHLNFVGDSILGEDVNLEAVAVIANFRNELEESAIRLSADDLVIETGVDKFGALVGDSSRIGANAVISPGAILPRASRVPRLTLVDQYPQAS
jgi:NDP-sugar pyrophosphorylase family protein